MEIIAYKVTDVLQVLGIGKLDARKIGSHTVIMADSVRRFMDGLPSVGRERT